MSPVLRGVRRPSASGHRRWSGAVGTVLVPAVLATLAVLYPGAPVAQVDLNDGAVWLTSSADGLVGRYNVAIDELNAALVAPSVDTDVLQDAGDVLVTSPGAVVVVDPAAVTLATAVGVPSGADVSMASGTVAVGDPATGEVWARTMATIGALSATAQAADLELGGGGRAVVARDGSVLAAEPDGTLLRAQVSDEGVLVEPDGGLAGAPRGGFDQVTAVGTELVVLVGSTVHTPTGSVDLAAHGEDLTLQQPGPQASVVLVASRTALLEVPLSGGSVREHSTGGSGRPAAPVRVGVCAHGAWATDTGSYLLRCDDAEPEVLDLEGMTTAEQLVFRVNREVVVLNDTVRGRVWVPAEDPALREPNWQDVEPQEQSDQDDEQSESQETTQTLQTECTAQSAPPVATDDDYGVRAGSTAILSVIDNDSSSDCGILAISEVDPLPVEFGVLERVYGGRALQLRTEPSATGTVEVAYTITDGRGSTVPSTATLRLTVRDAGLNEPPVQLRIGTATVEQGASVTYDVLPDFVDPDGDFLLLASASVADGGTVRSRQDGRLTFQSDGVTLGRRTVGVVVSDGTEVVEGTVFVDVRPAGSVPPVIDPVHAVTFIDQPVVVDPLSSVRTTSREPVRLAGVEQVPGATVTTDLPAGTFTFTAATEGTFYVPFVVTASPLQATGVARIDVLVRPQTPPPPIAVLDVALLPPGGEVTIDPLANDVNPAGNVLVLQSVEADPSTGLRLAPLERRLLRITSTRVLEAPVTVRYTMSNGSTSVVGEVLVIPVPAPATQQPPVVLAATAAVRTGGTVTIPVLEGASDPDGDLITLVPTLAEPPGPGEGLMFVSGDVLRFQAPATAMQVQATFSVADSAGNVTSALVTVSVHASDPQTKSPPSPLPLTARVFAGEVVRITVPLTGIDPDGDGVLLLGQDQAPLKGRVVAVGADWIDYEALPGELGTDTFTYAVEDWVGQRAVATVRVGIAPRPTTSTDVVSRNDDVLVRPGRSVEVR
ncbi:MAG TPA: Ig-like domain-containing protein, partial [Actinotalea sp.]|nr:Ig-like domain-containing protein [Actinotalea sp.]